MFIDDIRTDKSCIRISIIWIYHTIKLVEDHIKKEDIKMKLFVKLIFVANFLFLGGGFLIAFFQYVAYNGFGDIFDFYENSVYYNKKIPFLSYVGTKELKLNSPESGMVVFGFFFLFIFLIYRYADMDKWIGVYTRGEYKSSRKK